MLRIDLSAPLYPVDPGISLGEFERLIMGEDHEVAGVFGTEGRLVLAPKRGALDAVEFIEEEIPYLRGAIVTHNHPAGTVFSYDDMILASERDLAELRAVLPDGVVYAVLRPPGSWPSTDDLLDAVEQSIQLLRVENERRGREGASILRGRARNAFMIAVQQGVCAAVGVSIERTDVWRR